MPPLWRALTPTPETHLLLAGDKRVSIQLDKDEKLNHWDLSVEELLFMPGRVKGGKCVRVIVAPLRVYA